MRNDYALRIFVTMAFVAIMSGCGDPKQAEANDEMEKALARNEARVKTEIVKVTNERYYALRNKRGREMKEAQEKIEQELKVKTDAIDRIEYIEQSRIGNLRDFAIKEASSAWKTHQYFNAEIEVIDEKINQLDDATKTGDKSIQNLNKLRNALVRRVRTIERMLGIAYADKIKYDANPNNKTLEESWRKQILECSLYEECERKTYEAEKKGAVR